MRPLVFFTPLADPNGAGKYTLYRALTRMKSSVPT